MKRMVRRIILVFTGFFVAAGLLMAAGGGSVAQEPVEVDLQGWPMWPEPTIRINDLDINEPATFLSIGREIVPWPFFGPTTEGTDGYINLLGADLFFTIEEFTYDAQGRKSITAYRTVRPRVLPSDDLFMVLGNTTLAAGGLANEEIIEGYWDGVTLPGLQGVAVVPGYEGDWITYEEETDGETYLVEVANESFKADQTETPHEYLDDWKDFLVEAQHIGAGDFVFADSGHAPPQMIWPYDPWLYAYRTKTGYDSGPAAWADRYVCFWPTNQGALHAFEAYNVDIANSTPYVNRTWLAVPDSSFRQSVYHELRKAYGDGYKRLTVLDGPVTVRDVQINGVWKRIAVGTTGIGNKQLPKPQDAWTGLDQSEHDPSNGPPSVSDKGRVFGVYAFDVTDLEETATTGTLKSLWSVANVFYQTNEKTFSDYYVENNTGAAKADYAEYADMRFSVSKPLMGYTKDGSGDKTWHVIILGVDKDDRYLWLDVKPEDGSVRRSGYFVNAYTGNAETIESASYMEIGDLSAEEVENLFPSRILSAFPPPDSDYREPILSDVYVHLSNGGIYKWDLNPEETEPEWIVTLRSERGGEIAPPLTDFDISHLNGSTYLATNVLLRNVKGAAYLDTEALVILNLTEIEGLSLEERYTMKVPPGQEGTAATSKEDQPYLLVVQLELQHGVSTTESKTVLASPVFIDKRLFLAFYELSRQGMGKNPNYSMISRLYTFLFEPMMGAGNVQHLDEAEVVDGEILGDYFDLENLEAAMMFVDSLGNLVLLDSEGNVIGEPIPTGLELAQDEGGGTGPYSDPGVHLVYWKTS